MEIEYLKEFLVLAETNNFGLAAEYLSTSPPTLSRHIKSVEDYYGVILFERGPQGTSISDAGKLLAAHVEKMLSKENELKNFFAEKYGSTKNKLTIGYVRSSADYGVMKHLVSFRERHKEIAVTILENDPATLCKALKENHVDFVFSYDYPIFDKEKNVIIKLTQDHLAVALPEKHPLAHRHSISLNELENEHFILHKKGGTSYNYSISICEKAGFFPNVFTTAENGRYIVELVGDGVGISLLERNRTEKYCQNNVKLIDLEPKEYKFTSLIYKKRELNCVNESFLKFIKTVYNV